MAGDVFETWKTAHGDTVEVYEAGDGFRYRVQARNGEIGDVGGEAYVDVQYAAVAAARHHPDFADLDAVVEHLVDDVPERPEFPEVELLTDDGEAQVIEYLSDGPGGTARAYVNRRGEPDAVFYARVWPFGERPPASWSG